MPQLSLCRLLWLFRLLIVLHLSRLVGINWFASCLRAWPQKSDSVRSTDSEYPGKTAGCTSWWHGDNPTPPAPPLSGGAWRPQAGFWRRMPYVVCQFVGIWLVPWYVMKLGGLSTRHGERFHVTVPPKHHFRGTLLSTLMGQGQF